MATRGNSRPTPVGKQRVRTGCQTCRRRRRKCDERKPRCEACELKGFACKYGTDLTFVLQNKFIVEPKSVTPNADAPSVSGQNQSSGGFRHASVLAEPVARPDPRRSIAMAPNMDAMHSSHRGVSVETREPLIDIPPVGSEEKSRSYIEPDVYGERTGASFGAFEGLSEIPISGITRSQLEAISGASSQSGRPSTAASFTYTSPRPLPSRDPDATHETGLLSHYRYHVAPWLDIAAAEAPFGIGVLILARDKDSRPLFAAILALSALHRAVLNTPMPVNHNPSGWSIMRYRYRQEAETGLRFADREIRSVGTALLILDEVVSSGPAIWRSVLLNHIAVPGVLPALSQLVGETDEAVFWLYFRIDLAASLASGTAPLLPYDSYLTEDGSLRNILTGPLITDPTRTAFRQAMLLLARALSLTYNGHQEPHSNEDYIDASTFASSRPPTLSERWTLLWNKCQRWYATRSTEVQQILDVRGVEVDQVDPLDASSFPIIVYTTPLALVANAVYHTTSLLLLLHKPRLLKPLAGPRCLTSCIWHAQSIAGIAVCNDLPEQYDPILISGLFLAAKGMTHISQQTTVLECLGRITACTGIRLDQEVEDLKSIWNIAAFNESGM